MYFYFRIQEYIFLFLILLCLLLPAGRISAQPAASWSLASPKSGTGQGSAPVVVAEGSPPASPENNGQSSSGEEEKISEGFSQRMYSDIAQDIGADRFDEYKLSLNEAEERFLKNNLMLLAAKYQIDAKKAGIIQARLYANPNIFIEQNAFNPKTDRYFDVTRHGQTVVQIQQLFLLGGKIDKRIKVAEINTKISEQQFYDLLRALSYSLRRNFYKLFYMRELLKFYDKSVSSLENTLAFAEKSFDKRAILLSEVVRIKALLFFLKNERTNVLVDMKESEASIRVLINHNDLSNKRIVPIVNREVLDNINLDHLSKRTILETAYENRPDINLAIQNLRYEEANLELQIANSIPDLGFGPVYNRAGTYIPDYWGFTFQINVPVFDRNQGNIKAAEKSILVRRQELQNQKLQIENELFIVLNRALEKNKLYQQYKNKITEDYTKLADIMFTNYEKRYLTIIEFADFFETYRTTIMQMINLQQERVEAIESLNYAVGKKILITQPASSNQFSDKNINSEEYSNETKKTDQEKPAGVKNE